MQTEEIHHVIDLRSDVHSKAPPAMLKAMSECRVSNDANMDDEVANTFQKQIATLFGKEDALFFPTATMANLAAVVAFTRPGS